MISFRVISVTFWLCYMQIFRIRMGHNIGIPANVSIFKIGIGQLLSFYSLRRQSARTTVAQCNDSWLVRMDKSTYSQYVWDSIKYNEDDLSLFYNQEVTEGLHDSCLYHTCNLLHCATRGQVRHHPDSLLLAFEVALQSNMLINNLHNITQHWAM